MNPWKFIFYESHGFNEWEMLGAGGSDSEQGMLDFRNFDLNLYKKLYATFVIVHQELIQPFKRANGSKWVKNIGK